MNKVWISLIVIASSLALWLSSSAVISLWKYSFLTQRKDAKVESFAVIQKKDSQFAIEARYRFFHDSKEYRGSTEFHKPYYLNPYAAKAACKECESKSWQVYFCPSQPEISSLQRIFPFHECIKALITVLASVYFFFLKKLLHKMLPRESL